MLDQLELDEDDWEHRNPTLKTCTVPSLKSKVRYQDPDTNVWRKALVNSQAGKVGKTKIGLMWSICMVIQWRVLILKLFQVGKTPMKKFCCVKKELSM